MIKNRILAIILFMFSPTLFSQVTRIAVIVNINTNVDTLTIQEAKDIYLGKTRSFPNGDSAIPSLNENAEISESFLQKVVGKSSSQFNSYWNVRQFTGKGVLPHSFSNDEEVKHWLASHLNGIGFVSNSSMSQEKRVKAVLLLE